MTWIADYEIVRPLSGGGNGQFYIAKPPKRLGLDADEVAVKVVTGSVGDDPFQRIVNELRIFSAVQSDYLVTLLDAGQEEGSVYYAILLTNGSARLSDLGLAKFLAPGMTVTRTGAVGEIEFLEPGIIRGDRASRASDIWALGATLHRALTGKPIYPDLATDDMLASLRRVLNERPTLDPSLPATQSELIAQCLAADPASRPGTALAVANGLDGLGGQM
jgi:serine/threonine protein kinase